MSSDYRPRGGSSSGTGSSSGGPSRRRRGGRNRGGANRSGDSRPYSNGTNGTTSTPAKKEGPIAKLLGWLTGKKKADAKPAYNDRQSESAPRSTFNDTPREPRENRAPRAERPPRPDKPKQELVPQEIVSPKLYVGNLAYEAAESDLFDLFSKVGAVKNVEIAMDRHANRSKGFGFVEMETLDTAKEAAEKLNRTDFMGRQIVVSGAKLERRSVNNRDADGGESSETSAEETI